MLKTDAGNRGKFRGRAAAFLFWVLLIPAATHCNIRDSLTRASFTAGAEFANPDGMPERQFVRHGENVYSFRYRFYRTLIIDTSAGLVVVDPMNEKLAALARSQIKIRFPNKQVHSLFYSHYHRDHVEGGKHFAPRNVVAHRKCPWYWKDLPDSSRILKPTRFIQGDRTFTIGGETIRLIYLGLSHTDTLYAFHLPGRNLVYAPDVGFVKSWPTPGPFHTYFPGYIRAMEKIAALDFRVFVPSHGPAGTRQDFVDSMNMMKDLRATVVRAMREHDTETREGLGNLFDAVWPAWKKKYGHWRGFNEMAGLNLVRHMAGVDLGY